MHKWAAMRDELIKISALERAHYLLGEIEGVCPIHGVPMLYRDLEQQESYCPLDEGVKEKRAYQVRRMMKRMPLKTVMKYKTLPKVMRKTPMKVIMSAGGTK